MKHLLILLSTFLLFACSPQKRLNRLINKHAELLSIKDTVTVRDTFIVDGVKLDTIFQTTITKDTVILKEKQLTIKYYNDGKTTYLDGECDTIIQVKEIQVPIEKVKAVTEYKTHWYDIAIRWICGAICVIPILFIALNLLRLK